MLLSRGGGARAWMWLQNAEGRGCFPICFPLREDGRGGQHESKTQKAAHNKVRYIVTRMLHIAKPLLMCIVFGRWSPSGPGLLSADKG